MLTPPNSLNLTQPNTPIIEIGSPQKDTRLWLKRDDLTGIELSGNKIRKLDFLLQQAIDDEAQGIITCGGLQSNHCRATAYAGAKLGLETILYLRGKPETIPTGNHFLNILVGSTIHYVTQEEYHEIDSIMMKKSQELANRGKQFYVIPEGGSNEIGAWGYIQCFYEIIEQIEARNLSIYAIAVSTGSGGTHAGLLIGKLLKKSDIDIISINVCDDADYFKVKISDIINKFEQKYDHAFDVHKNDILIYDGFTGSGYGEIGNKEVDVIKRFIRKEGIVLDPVYTAKAYLGLEELINQRRLEYKNILFIHTGGIFGIFPLVANFL
jgi:D-cysteine desulfhydrase